MMTSAPIHSYKHHRFPAEIISHGVWLYFRFWLSYRDVEELLFVHGVSGSYEAMWHLDGVVLTINKERHPLSSCCLGWYGYVRTARAMRRNGEPQKGHPRRVACRRQRTDALNMGQCGRVGA